jgi:hypothetical protein
MAQGRQIFSANHWQPLDQSQGRDGISAFLSTVTTACEAVRQTEM